ncbi:MAG: ABC transporter permease [Lachnospiraceae bacterium]|nr:ABC transporter permease [Lachnospiraceae bacterium]
MFLKVKKCFQWFADIYANRRLIVNLANKDFKMRYAASYLGAIWAFVQPIVTVAIYIFVFQFGLRAGNTAEGVPYSLWLVAGMVPWLFFFEALTNATNSLLEYSYLVKKVVFKISVLPIVKILTALYVHVFFIGVAIVVYLLFGYTLTISLVQVIYYTFAATALVLCISYITSALVIFFRDLGQIVNIILQFMMWLTPILWRLEDVDIIPDSLHWIFKLNPIHYITSGYRDAFIYGTWFYEKPLWTLYFWCFILVTGIMGIFTFKKLEKHFADVL